MKQLIEFSLPNGGTFFAEVEEAESEAVKRAALSPSQLAAKAKKSFNEVLDQIQPMAAEVVTRLTELKQSADEVEVKFGIKLSAEVGAVVTFGGEANYEITLKWIQKQPASGQMNNNG